MEEKTLEQALQSAEKQNELLREQLAYLGADLENMKKRFEKDRLNWSIYAQIELFKKLLPIVDDFDRAFQYGFPADVQSHMVGFELVHKAFQKYIKDAGVQEIDTTVPFDPEKHEAVAQVADATKQSGEISSVLQKGYIFKDIIIRPAQVVVVQ